MQILLTSLTFMLTVALTMITGIAAGYVLISGLLALFGRRSTEPRPVSAPATVQGD